MIITSFSFVEGFTIKQHLKIVAGQCRVKPKASEADLTRAAEAATNDMRTEALRLSADAIINAETWQSGNKVIAGGKAVMLQRE